MNSKEICEILKASKGTGIKEIKLDKITLKFDNLTLEAKSINNSTKTVLNTTPHQLNLMNEVSDVTSIYEEKQIEKEAKEVLDEFQVAHLMATDPVAFEDYQKGL